jgi:low temperature requirement protein LtrA
MEQRLLWSAPVLRTDEEEGRHRKASWLELFYDLVFVAVVAELAHALSGDLTWEGAGKFVALFIPVWWIWVGGAFYNDRFEIDDISHRLAVFIQMVPIAGMALFVAHGLDDSFRGFALSYALARTVLNLLWFRAGYHNPVARPLTNRYAVGFGWMAALLVVAVFLPSPWRYVVWTLAVAVDLLTPATTWGIQARLPRLSRSHLPERFGLLTIIVLGEAVIGAIAGIAEGEALSLTGFILAGLALMIAISVWWIYFDQIADRPPHRTIYSTAAWGYLHLPLAAGITAVGVGALHLIAEADHDLQTAVGWTLALAVAAALVAIGLIEVLQIGEHGSIERAFRFGGAALALAIGAFGPTIGPLPFALLLALLMTAQVVQGLLAPTPMAAPVGAGD